MTYLDEGILEKQESRGLAPNEQIKREEASGFLLRNSLSCNGKKLMSVRYSAGHIWECVIHIPLPLDRHPYATRKPMAGNPGIIGRTSHPLRLRNVSDSRQEVAVQDSCC